ncbi:threonine-phosphate decarboxylase CobD [Clostridium sp. MCC353]|uniref:threonine-phosphate decarboxylase CobD n=1 Tax=Clostridium sp. MCC353 TaxID=2592646 RepID=UPI001C029B6E|nr:threonine-phosphate decarboxylase CobD [Clostridium sp. MCC353]
MKTHGGDIFGVAAELGVKPEECLDFSANLNPLGVPKSVRDAMKESLDQVIYYPDPDCRELIHDLSGHYGVPEGYLLAGNGAADLIFRLVYGIRPSNALIPAPTFLEYEEALKQTKTRIIRLPLDENLEVPENLPEFISEEIDLVFLCNPNNPTGILTGRDLMIMAAKKAVETGTILVIDECFLDFTGREEEFTMVPYLKEFPNMVILKSFTKMFSIPGIRLGYALCSDPDLINRIRAAGQSWSVNTAAAAAGRAALKEVEFVRSSAAFIKEEREFLTGELKKLGIRVFPGQANYLFIQVKSCPGLYDKLLRYGIMIRRCLNYDGLDETYYRTAVRNREENKGLIKALKSIIEGEEKNAAKTETTERK